MALTGFAYKTRVRGACSVKVAGVRAAALSLPLADTPDKRSHRTAAATTQLG
jgi:hypothetical protein